MATTGPLDLLVFGFDAERPLAPEVKRQLNLLRGRGSLQILDVLFISRDEQGAFRVEEEGDDLHPRSAVAESTLWQLFGGDDEESMPTESLELHSAREIGLDLAAVEGLARLITPLTRALLVLVELGWATDLLEAVLESDGTPLLSGRLEPETMLAIGPKLAATVRAARADERTTALRGAAMLDALATTHLASSTAAGLIRPLVAAGLLDDCDVEHAVGALADAGLIPRSSLAQARDQAIARVAEIGRLGSC